MKKEPISKKIVFIFSFISVFLLFCGIFIKPGDYLYSALIIANLITDVLLSTEFIYKYFFYFTRKKDKFYIRNNNGMIDMLGSFPSLLFYSLPGLFYIFMSYDVIGNLPGNLRWFFNTFNIINILLLLRGFRVAKLFNSFYHPYNVTGRNILRLNRYISAGIVIAFCFYLFVTSDGIDQKGYRSRGADEEKLVTVIEKIYNNFYANGKFAEYLKMVLVNNKTISEIKTDGKSVYKNSAVAASGNYKSYFKNDHFEIYFTEKSSVLMGGDAGFVIIFFILLIISTFYRQKLDKEVVNPVRVMRKGFELYDYNLLVDIPDEYQYSEDDVFMAARNYNDKWIPIKLKKLEKPSGRTPLITINDFFIKGE